MVSCDCCDGLAGIGGRIDAAEDTGMVWIWVTVMEPDSILTVPWAMDVLLALRNPVAAAAACNISSFFMHAASMLAARFGVGWLEEIPAGFDTNEVSRDISFGFAVSTTVTTGDAVEVAMVVDTAVDDTVDVAATVVEDDVVVTDDDEVVDTLDDVAVEVMADAID